MTAQDAAARTEIITTHLEQMEMQLQQTRDTVGALRELLSPVRNDGEPTFRGRAGLGGTPTDPTTFTATEICWPIFSTTPPPD